MLKNIDKYCEKFELLKLPKKTHPDEIYTDPISNIKYFFRFFSRWNGIFCRGE